MNQNKKTGKSVYLIVGASGTIGSAVARGLAGNDIVLGLHYNRNKEAVLALGREIEALRCEYDLFQADLESETACEQLVDNFCSRWGKISGMAICHGDVQWKKWDELVWKDWMEIMKQHCFTPYSLVKSALPAMAHAGSGKIVYLSSISPKYAGSEKSVHYASAKGALEIAMRGIAREAARLGVNINGVRSGFVLTPQQTEGRTQQELEERILKIPLGRGGKPAEVASAIIYLLSEAASFITGAIITVAGGD